MLEALFAGLRGDDPVVRSRATHALATLSGRRPDWLTPHKAALLDVLATDEQPEVLWHLALVVPRLALDIDGPDDLRKLMAWNVPCRAAAWLQENGIAARRRFGPLLADVAA